MGQVVAAMKTAGKTTYLEVVSLFGRRRFARGKAAVEQGLDVLMGTVYFPSIGAYFA
jgi:hypothetical protein